MPVSAETLRLLVDAGIAGDDLISIVASIDADMATGSAQRPRSKAAERQARYRERKEAKTSQSVTSDVTSDVTPPPSSPSPSSPRPPSTTTSPSSPPTKEKPPSGSKRNTSLPEGFPDLKAKEAAKAYWREQGRPDLCERVDRIATAFEAHHAAKGSKFADWRRAWQTWYVNQVDMTKPPPSAPAPTKATSKRDEERYRLERLRDDGMWIDTLWGIKPFMPDGSFNEMYVKEGGSKALVEQVFGRRELPLEKAL